MAAPRDVKAILNYLLPQSKGGSDVSIPGTAADKKRKRDPREMTIIDMRGSENTFKLDIHGFEPVRRPVPSHWLQDENETKTSYYNDCVDLVKESTGASVVYPLSHVTGRGKVKPEQTASEEQSVNGLPPPNPSHWAHVDVSYDGAPLRVAGSHPDIYEQLAGKRWAWIGIWRPTATVTRSPFAMCDARSVPESDLREVMAEFRNANNGTDRQVLSEEKLKDGYGVWEVLPPTTQEHKWYYWSEMEHDEVLMMKMFDTKEQGVSRYCVHTAFRKPDDYGPPRQSIQLRMIAVWDEEPKERE
ncbi:hypothetical protein BST61_g5330 [Cercospora zeina]